MADLHEILNAIDPSACDYTEWVQVGMGIKHEGGSLSDWEAWSARDGARYHQGECAKKWDGFHGSTSPVTMGSLVNLALQHGWSPRRDWGEDAAYGWETTTIYDPFEGHGRIDPTWVEPADIAAPADFDWNPVRELITYLETLFEATDYVGYVTDCWRNEDGKALPTKGAYTRTAGELIAELSRTNTMDAIGTVLPDVGAWIRFNPLDGKGIRDANVTALRYALVESDSMSIEMQAALYERLNLPIAALVHSGGKSLHAIVRINATTMEEYRKRVDFLHKVCNEAGLKIDTQNKNPSRLSRMPGVTRNGNKQYLVATNKGAPTFEEWQDAILESRDDLPDFEALSSVYDDLPKLADPLIDGVLREGHKMLLSGPSKAGKSYMLLQLTLAIAEGREWLGWTCAQGRVLYVNLELDRASCLHRIRDLYNQQGWAPENLGNIDLWNLRGKAVPMDALAPKLIRRAQKQGYKAIIIDPIYKVITGDENAADKMAFFCNQFDRVCSELGAAVIYCHHHSKGAQGQKSARDRSSGSGVFARDPDAILDIIELNVSESSRKAMVERQIANAVGAILDRARPGWRDDFPEDDVLVETKVLEHARALFGSNSIDNEIAPLRTSLAGATGWRMEGTLREFAPMAPRVFWFRHPFHTTTEADVLLDAKAEGEEPPWIEQQRAAKDAKAKESAERRERLLFAFNDLAFETGAADAQVMAEAVGLIGKDGKPNNSFTGLLTALKLKRCHDGNVRTAEDAKAWDAENPPDLKPTKKDAEMAANLHRCRMAILRAQREAPDGIARIGAVANILDLPGKNPINTVRGWVGKCTEFQRNSDGTITVREDE